MAKSIHQEMTFKANAQKVYAALTTSETFGELTGAPANIETAAGGEFELFGGQIGGRQVELIPGKRLVQVWRAGNWEDGVHSIVRFELEEKGGETKVVFDHTGYPEDQHEMLEGGWHKMYWEPLTSYLS